MEFTQLRRLMEFTAQKVDGSLQLRKLMDLQLRKLMEFTQLRKLMEFTAQKFDGVYSSES